VTNAQLAAPASGPKTKTEKLLDEIREVNLTYLLLAQHMIHADRAQAQYRLGICAETAELIKSLTPGQLLKIAQSSLLVCRFRFDDRMVWNLLTGHSRDRNAAASHASILLAGQVNEVLDHAAIA
jgi:flagellar transcriptional activator FlhD